jgi:hypothetical protein
VHPLGKSDQKGLILRVVSTINIGCVVKLNSIDLSVPMSLVDVAENMYFRLDFLNKLKKTFTTRMIFDVYLI